MEAPAHAFLKCLRCAASGARETTAKRHVAMRQVNPRGIEVVGQERAALASFFPAGSEHEMINDQLAAAGEKIGERLRTVRAFEDVVLLDAFPRQFAPLPAQFVPLAG